MHILSPLLCLCSGLRYLSLDSVCNVVTSDEIGVLFEKYKGVSSSLNNDGVIDIHEFQRSLGFKNSECASRLFHAIDLNGDRVVNFEEFCKCIAIYCGKTTYAEKLAFSFRLFDYNGDGCIDREELFVMLRACLYENTTIELSERQVKAVVDATFDDLDLNGDGKISFDEYRAYMLMNPALLDNFTFKFGSFSKNPFAPLARSM